jgi:hypothetical protein
MERSTRLLWLFPALTMLAAWIGLSEEIWRYFTLSHALTVLQQLDPDKTPAAVRFFADVPMDDAHRKLLAALIASPQRDAITLYRSYVDFIRDCQLQTEQQMLIWSCAILALLAFAPRLLRLSNSE